MITLAEVQFNEVDGWIWLPIGDVLDLLTEIDVLKSRIKAIENKTQNRSKSSNIPLPEANDSVEGSISTKEHENECNDQEPLE